MSRRVITSSFEEARRTLKNLFMNTTSWKERPRIVDIRTKPILEEVTYKELLQDLYISYLEDEKDRRDYWKQVEAFEEWYRELSPGLDHYLVERWILRDEYSQKTEVEARELVDTYFRGITKVSLKDIF